MSTPGRAFSFSDARARTSSIRRSVFRFIRRYGGSVKRDGVRKLALAAIVAVAAAACGGTSDRTPDAAPGDGAAGDGPSGDAPTDTGAMGCDPVAQRCGGAQ